LTPTSIDLIVERNVLTVRAERQRPYRQDVEQVITERPMGTFSRAGTAPRCPDLTAVVDQHAAVVLAAGRVAAGSYRPIPAREPSFLRDPGLKSVIRVWRAGMGESAT
jgi:hypothetical protein